MYLTLNKSYIKKITPSEIYKLIPEDIKEAQYFLDNINEEILYDFGEPLNICNNKIHSFGGIQNIPFKNLSLAIDIANKNLSDQQKTEWLKKIENKNKHEDFLFEMRPLLELKSEVKIEYETTDNCEQNKNIDWKIIKGDINVLLEVKNRIKPIINNLENTFSILKEYRSGVPPEDIKIPSIKSNSKSLFKSVVNKFKPQKNDNYLQGVWINTIAHEEKKELDEYFNKNIDSTKIQFAIFSGWDNKAYILSRNNKIKKIILDLFSLKESDDFVY